MGNPFSPLIAELFMASFEINLRERNMLPKSWLRYGDKVFAVISKDDVQKTFDVLNNQFQSIKFTCEPEYNGELPSLDLNLQRNDNEIDVGVYHKPTRGLFFENCFHTWIVQK